MVDFDMKLPIANTVLRSILTKMLSFQKGRSSKSRVIIFYNLSNTYLKNKPLVHTFNASFLTKPHFTLHYKKLPPFHLTLGAQNNFPTRLNQKQSL